MADSREEFEAWAKARSLPLDRLPNDEYAGYQVHTAWLCWQHRDADIAALRAEVERLRKDAERSVGKTAARCREMAMWPQGIDDEQAYYGSMFAEFITKEFGAAIDAAMRQEGGG